MISSMRIVGGAGLAKSFLDCRDQTGIAAASCPFLIVRIEVESPKVRLGPSRITRQEFRDIVERIGEIEELIGAHVRIRPHGNECAMEHVVVCTDNRVGLLGLDFHVVACLGRAGLSSARDRGGDAPALLWSSR
jgi:hypothetical protein